MGGRDISRQESLDYRGRMLAWDSGVISLGQQQVRCWRLPGHAPKQAEVAFRGNRARWILPPSGSWFARMKKRAHYRLIQH
jgi:hypothetical protein